MKITPIFLSLILFVSISDAEVDPVEELSSTVNDVLDVLYDETLSLQVRPVALEEAIEQNFSFSLIARRAMGRNWRLLNGDQQEEFVDLFADLLIQTYSSGFQGGARPEIIWDGHKPLKEGQIEVYSNVTMDGATFPVNYRMILFQEKWQVYDVLVENISLVGNYRKQFISMLPRGSQKEVEAMLNTLREKISEG